MLIPDADVLRIYTSVLDGDGEAAGTTLSDYLERLTQPLRAADSEERCGAGYDPWNEGDVRSRCTLRKGHETETRIHAEYGEGHLCKMWWHQ